jgi:hypothetical protein
MRRAERNTQYDIRDTQYESAIGGQVESVVP